VSRLESDYYRFMGYDSDRAREALAHYPQFFPAGPVLELGPGRGEFLDLLRAAGVAAYGVDVDEGMVERAVAAGHDVRLGDAVEHLEHAPARSLGGVFCAHFLEHLAPGDVARVYAAAARAIRPAGAFVAVVPHAGSLSVLGYDFWRDPTHVRFYDPMLLAFFAAQAGLDVAESGGNPRNSPGPPPPTFPMEFTPGGSLRESLTVLAHSAQAVYRTPPSGDSRHRHDAATAPVADARAGLWEHVVHVLSELDQRIQTVQHHNAVLRTAYTNLLAQLYPPSEVYVVAHVPAEEDHT